MLPGEVPDGLDPVTMRRVVRSLLLVRIVRGALVLLFLALSVLGVVARGWPRGVVVGLVLAIAWQLGTLVVSCRRYARTRTDDPAAGSTVLGDDR